MYISYPFAFYRLLYTVVDKCAPRFDSVNKQMGVGLYSDSVFVDIRQAFHLMEESLDNLPDGVDRETFENNIKDRYVLARGKHKQYVNINLAPQRNRQRVVLQIRLFLARSHNCR